MVLRDGSKSPLSIVFCNSPIIRMSSLTAHLLCVHLLLLCCLLQLCQELEACVELQEEWRFAIVTAACLLKAAAVVGGGRGHLRWTVEQVVQRSSIVEAHAQGNAVSSKQTASQFCDRTYIGIR